MQLDFKARHINYFLFFIVLNNFLFCFFFFAPGNWNWHQTASDASQIGVFIKIKGTLIYKY